MPRLSFKATLLGDDNLTIAYTGMRALRQLGRSASSTLLLGRSSDATSNDHHEAEEDGASSGGTETPLDKTLTRIGFGTYQKKLL